jgi:putative Mn2+ efflux pump MntP
LLTAFLRRANALAPTVWPPMNPVSILLLGFAMSTDAFAAAIGKGASMTRPRLGQALRVGLIFGVIEAITPVVGWLLGKGASRYIAVWDHWIAFGLLLVLGLHMIWNGLKPESNEPIDEAKKHGFAALALTGLSTSIDALAVGVGLAFVDTPIAVVAVVIGLCTFSMVTLGIMLGRVLGAMVGRRAEMIGGIILIGVGAVILYEHLSV